MTSRRSLIGQIADSARQVLDSRRLPNYLAFGAAYFMFATIFSAMFEPAFRHRFFTWRAISNWGLVFDILGFLMLRAEWKMSGISPLSLQSAELKQIEAELAVLYNRRASLTPEEANKSHTRMVAPGGIIIEKSVNEKISDLETEMKTLIGTEPEKYAHRRRVIRFEIGSALIVIGFLGQFLGNLFSK